MTEAAPAPAVTPDVVNPGKTLGIVGLVMAFIFVLNIVGLILSIIGLRKSKNAGLKNGPALAGIIVSIVTILGGIVILVTAIALTAVGITALQELCEGQAPGVYDLTNGTQITCP